MIARSLLDAGKQMLEARYRVESGGLEASDETLAGLVEGADALVSDASVPVGARLLDAAGDRLRVVANFAVGFDNIDLLECERRGVLVTNTPDVLTNATAELALTLTLAAARRATEAEDDLRSGRWHGWDPAAHLGLELSGATVGVVGLGRIGARYAELLAGFGVRLLHASRSAKPELEARLGIEPAPLEDLLARADVISLHAPATPETRHLIDAGAISRMKPTAVLVNTGRGSLVDGDALALALREGRIGAAGLDVFEHEPGVEQSLLDAPRAVLLPHIGSATHRARDAMAATVAENVISVLEEGRAVNPVRAA